MMCLVTLPDCVVMEVELESQATGEDCLLKVSSALGIVEVDYLGLQLSAGCGEWAWLNLRNRMSQQLENISPWRLQLRVKYYMEPHLLLQEATRHLLFLQVQQQLSSGLLVVPVDRAEELCALLAQARYGDYKNPEPCYKQLFRQTTGKEPETCSINSMVEIHRQLQGRGQAAVEYCVLQLLSSAEFYGVEWRPAQTADGQPLSVGVGPSGLLTCTQDLTPLHRVNLSLVLTASQTGRNVYVTVTTETGGSEELLFKMATSRAAEGLYRSLTETHAFYRCDSVSSEVMQQVRRDLRGHLAALLGNQNPVGTTFFFDVQRTATQAYDRARRKLYLASQSTHGQEGSAPKLGGNMGKDRACSPSPAQQHKGCKQEKVLEDMLLQLQDSLLCLCCQEEMDAVFCPCGHMVCCQSCASLLEVCPVCRAEVDRVQKVYLPGISNLLRMALSQSSQHTAAPNHINTSSGLTNHSKTYPGSANHISSSEFYSSNEKAYPT